MGFGIFSGNFLSPQKVSYLHGATYQRLLVNWNGSSSQSMTMNAPLMITDILFLPKELESKFVKIFVVFGIV